MINAITTVCNYLIMIFLAVFTFDSFRAIKDRPQRDRNKLSKIEVFCMFAIHFMGYLVIYLNLQTNEVLTFYGMQVLYFILVLGLYPVFYPNVNKALLCNMSMLIALGFIVITRLNYDKAVKQFTFICGATIVTIIVPLIIRKFKNLYKLKWLYFALGLGLLAMVLFLGVTTRGAKLSISFGPITLQPSEFVKVVFVFFVASVLSQKTNFKTVCFTTLMAGSFVLILVASTDLGSALIFFLVYVFLLYVATKKKWYLFAGIGAGTAASVLAYQLFSHIRVRIKMWQNPWSDENGKGYQIIQSLFAIGTGSWFGTGLFRGKPNTVPIVIKDFIFAAIVEELGGVTGIIVIMLCMSTFMIFIKIAMMQKNNFNKLIATGLGIAYAFQVFLTIGASMNMIPLTGVTLPLISYGGSSALCTMIMFSILQGLHILAVDEEKKNEREKSKTKEQDRYRTEISGLKARR